MFLTTKVSSTLYKLKVCVSYTVHITVIVDIKLLTCNCNISVQNKQRLYISV